nr:AAA family ATPase [uncultured Rhodoferax sp.]
MKLTNAQIRHYKSLADIHVSLHPNVTVVVGPNAVGKSNFVDALRFLRDAAKDDLDHAIVSRGGLTRIRQNSAGRPFNVGLSIEALQTFDENTAQNAAYSLEIASASGGNYRVESEDATCYQEMTYRQANGQYSVGLQPSGFTRDKAGNFSEKGVSPPTSHHFGDVEQLALGRPAGDLEFHRLGADLHAYIRGWKFSALYPITLRQLTTPDTDASLREDGSNWASVIRAAKRTTKGRRTLERINEMMQVVLPDFLEVTVSTVGSYLVPKFRFGPSATDYREFDPVQLSDGTLRIFGILLSLYQSPAPTLMIVEEPEQTVHPGVLSMLAEAFKEVSEVTQVIVTTHSPQLIDHFDPENIRVVTMNGGLTNIAPIKRSQHEAVKLGLMSLGEFMAAEGLQPSQP